MTGAITTINSATAEDFWRSEPADIRPDGNADTTEAILHRGLAGIGAGFPAATAPVATLDVAAAGRSGVDGRAAGVTPFYVTGNLPALGNNTSPPAATPVGGAEIRHSNQSQGFGFAYDGIYATGSNPDQNFGVMNRGAGQFFRMWQTLLGGFNYDNEVGAALGDVQGWQHRWWAAGVQVATDYLRKRTNFQGGAVGMERFWQLQRPDGAFTNHSRQTWSFSSPNTPAFCVNPGNQVGDQLLTLYGDAAATDGTYALGIKGSTLAYFVGSSGAFHRFYTNPAPGTMLFSISGVGNVTVDPNGVAPAGWASPVLRFGSEGSSEAIKSQRTGAGPDVNALSFYTSAAQRMSVRANGRIFVAALPGPFATDALAGAAGVLSGELYSVPGGLLGAVTLVARKN